MHRHVTPLSIAWVLMFAALVLWFSAAPMPGWWLGLVVIAALVFGLANRYPQRMPRRLAAPSRRSR